MLLKWVSAGLSLTAALLAATVAYPANAGRLAGASAVTVRDWSGLYLGGSVGGRRAHSDLTLTAIDQVFTGSVQHDLPACTTYLFPCATGASLDQTALRTGVYGGYSWQLGERVVAGIEGDWAWAHKSATADGFKFELGNVSQDSSFSVTTKWDASARLRLGFLATPSFLVYVTGGAAWQKADISSNCGTSSCYPGTVSPAVVTQSSVWDGWTIGGGVETMLSANWLLRAEYRYSDFGTKSFMDNRPCSPSPSPSCGMETSLDVSYGVSMRTQTAMVGLAYKFGGGSVLRP